MLGFVLEFAIGLSCLFGFAYIIDNYGDIYFLLFPLALLLAIGLSLIWNETIMKYLVSMLEKSTS